MSPAPRGGKGRGRGRATRQRTARGASVVGTRFEVEVGPVAHGGHCVARVPVGDPTSADEPVDTRVVFVRHALPGERVVLEITEGTEGDRFWRGDAVEILNPSADRVEAPCRFAGPGQCGGCDFQHVALSAQRALKAQVVAEQLRRLAKIDLDVTVEAVPGDEQGLRWRTRQRYITLPEGGRGLRRHRSHDVIPVDTCLLEAPAGPSYVVRGAAFEVADGGFWQVHPGAPDTLVGAVLDALKPQPGESAIDLYAGVGLFSRFLADAVGPTGRVAAVEGDSAASALSERNVPGITARAGDVAAVLAGGLPAAWDQADLVVLDPPRAGAKRAVVEAVVSRQPRAVAYVACDPAALARDVAIFAEHGYELTGLRAFDLFPMTHHVECVALLTKSGSDLR